MKQFFNSITLYQYYRITFAVSAGSLANAMHPHPWTLCGGFFTAWFLTRVIQYRPQLYREDTNTKGGSQ